MVGYQYSAGRARKKEGVEKSRIQISIFRRRVDGVCVKVDNKEGAAYYKIQY